MPNATNLSDIDYFFQEAKLERENASWRDIKKAFRKLALKYHPDRFKKTEDSKDQGKLESEYLEICQRITTAYAQLEKMYAVEEPENKESKTEDYASRIPFQDEENPDAIVPQNLMVKVYFPIYVLKTTKPEAFSGYGVSLTAGELESPARFSYILKRINDALKSGTYQVGLDRGETIKIINQHSYYKDRDISFIGALELHVPFTNINPRKAESWARTTPYFWLKQNTQIFIQNVHSFSPAIPDYNSTTPAMKNLQQEFKPTAEIPLIMPSKPFDFYQPLTTKELIAEALEVYRREYVDNVRFNTANQSILDNIIKMQKLLSSDDSEQNKLEIIQTLKTQFGGRFNIILCAMEQYYLPSSPKKIDSQQELPLLGDEIQPALPCNEQSDNKKTDNLLVEEQPLPGNKARQAEPEGTKEEISLFAQYVQATRKLDRNLSLKERKVASIAILSDIVKQADNIEELSAFYNSLNSLELRAPFFKRERHFFRNEAGVTFSWKIVLGEIKEQAMALAIVESKYSPATFQSHHDLYHDIFKIRRSRMGLIKPDSLKAFERLESEVTSNNPLGMSLS